MSPLRVAGLLAVALAGCTSNPTALNEASTPNYDPDGIARAILTEFDKDGDGSIDQREAGACPALQAAFAEIDTNRDRKLSADELRARAEAYAKTPTGSVAVGCTVTVGGQPLTGATVTFVPEACMGGAIKEATGKTDEAGRCDVFQIDGKSFRGLAAGLYKVRVTKEGVNLPARFNAETVLGREVFHNPRRGEATIDLNLPSR
jgi:hypothetical protein